MKGNQMKKVTDAAGTTATVSVRPGCDMHRAAGKSAPAEYDSKTHMGPWAYMCADCFRVYGSGLGMGRGQRLIVRDEP